MEMATAQKTRLEIDARVFNTAYLPHLETQDRFLVLYGGAGSGKSYFAAQKKLYRALSEPGHRFLIARKVAKTLRHSVFQLFRDVIGDWGLTGLFKVNKSDMEISCLNGSQLLFVGLDDVEKLKSITRITGIWVEEASELLPTDLRQLNLRLRGPTPSYKQIVLSFNPVDAESWLKRDFFDAGPRPGVTIVHTTYKHNRFLDAEYIAELEALKEQDLYYYQVYCLGEWGSIGNLILTNWVVEDIRQDPSDYDAASAGLDFGFNHPSAYLDLGLRDGDVYVLNEVYERGLTNTQLIDRVKQERRGRHAIVADSAEPARIQEFRAAGLPARAALKGPDSVKAGIDWLRRRRIHVHPSCVNTIKELRAWKYREDKNGNVLEEPVEYMDDAMAALRYGTENWRLESVRTSVTNIALDPDAGRRESPWAV